MAKKVTYVIVVLAIASLFFSVFGFVFFYSQIIGLQQTVDDLVDRQFSDYPEITLVDRMGNVVTLTSAPLRIVSLSPSNTEILFAIGAGAHVVGVTDSCDYPCNFTTLEASNITLESTNVTRIGSVYNPPVKPIVDLEPDLVLATTLSLETAEDLQALGFNVLVVEARTISEVLDDILLVGRATGNNAEATAFVIVMKAKIDVVANIAARAETTPKVYYEFRDDPLVSVGPGTLVDELITLAGGVNICNTETESLPLISSESVIEKNPDVMIFPSMYVDAANFSDTLASVKDRPGWSSITAVQDDALYGIDAEIVSRTGPRIVEALRAFAQMIHPELFASP